MSRGGRPAAIWVRLPRGLTAPAESETDSGHTASQGCAPALPRAVSGLRASRAGRGCRLVARSANTTWSHRKPGWCTALCRSLSASVLLYQVVTVCASGHEIFRLPTFPSTRAVTIELSTLSSKREWVKTALSSNVEGTGGLPQVREAKFAPQRTQHAPRDTFETHLVSVIANHTERPIIQQFVHPSKEGQWLAHCVGVLHGGGSPRYSQESRL